MATKKTRKAKLPPKAAPVSVVKAAEAIEGPLPLSQFDYQFCALVVQLGKQAQAYRQLRPEAKNPHTAASRMMERPEIVEHIRAIYAYISKERDRAASLSARACLLTLDLADDRLAEILTQRRKSRGEMFTKDIKQLMVKGALPQTDDDGNITGYAAAPELLATLEEGAPVEDADLLKAIKLLYERKQGIVKAEAVPEAAPVATMLYRPNWMGKPKLIEGSVS